MNKLGFILLVLSLCGCSIVGHLDELSLLGQYSREKEAQSKLVKAIDDHYDALVASINSGTIKNYGDQDAIRKDFGEPLLTAAVQMDGQTQQQWIYRYAIQSKAKDRVYLYFDKDGKDVKLPKGTGAVVIVSIILIAVALVLLVMVLMRQGSLEKNQDRGQQQMIQNLSNFTQMNEQKLERIRESVERKLAEIQQDNSQKLEKMRETVDEKLHATLEKRLGESFKLVSDRLEKVHQGLGEMQTLASGVGDLKKVLTNVKTRGTWGEVQLGNLLEQILTPEQYVKNFITKKGSRDPVEFAIKLPGAGTSTCGAVYLPIDAKFPTEDYERIQNAQEAGNVEAIEQAAKALEARLKLEGKNIREKYLDPPNTTDFGILFLPTEGLYAESLRRVGLVDTLRQEYRVIVAGPSTIAALLNSLQMGFRTLAVEKRASEVWALLGTVKGEFGKFGDLLEKTKEKLDLASKNIDDAARKSRTIEKKLRDVQDDLPSTVEKVLLEEI